MYDLLYVFISEVTFLGMSSIVFLQGLFKICILHVCFRTPINQLFKTFVKQTTCKLRASSKPTHTTPWLLVFNNNICSKEMPKEMDTFNCRHCRKKNNSFFVFV